MRVFSTFEEIEAAAGEEIGASDWVEITQERVDQFAEATDDFQWIHVDQEKAKAGPFGGTIAHGYLTLSLIPCLSNQVFGVETEGAKLNYGLNKVRFPNPVPVGARVRAVGHGRRGRRDPRGQAADHEVRHRDRGPGQARLRRGDRRPAAELSASVSLPA